MTYDEAVIYRLSHPTTFLESELKFTTYVTPRKPTDFTQYCRDFRINKNIGDDFALLYSSDKQFSVYGICYFPDINMLYYRFLE